jgi:hypothetical protein
MSKQQQVLDGVVHLQQQVCKASYPHNAHASHQTNYLLLLLQVPQLLASHPSTRLQSTSLQPAAQVGVGVCWMSCLMRQRLVCSSTNNRPWVRSRACKRALLASVTCLPAARGRAGCNRQAEAQEGCGSDGVETTPLPLVRVP